MKRKYMHTHVNKDPLLLYENGVRDIETYSNNEKMRHTDKCFMCKKMVMILYNPNIKIYYIVKYNNSKEYDLFYYAINILVQKFICRSCISSSKENILLKLKIKKKIKETMKKVYYARFKNCRSIKIEWGWTKISYQERTPLIIFP